MTMVRLRLGLLEQDIAFRFQVSQSTVSRITCTWIIFLYLKLKRNPTVAIQRTHPDEYAKGI